MIKSLQARIGYEFRDMRLLTAALTHPSYASDHHVNNYQRLEFLGDAVLELYVSEALYRKHASLTEGQLTRMRAELVREETLARAAKRLGLDALIRLSPGEEKDGGRAKPSILCDVMEALVGAAYIDGGRDVSSRVIRAALGDNFEDFAASSAIDAKSQLQTILQKRGEMPEYVFVRREGPPHQPKFTYDVFVNGVKLGEGEGASKQAAQLDAARKALEVRGMAHEME